MCEKCRKIDLGFTSETFEEGQHIAYIFRDNEERRATMSKYLGAGIKANEKVLYLADTISREELYSELADLGIDVNDPSNDVLSVFDAEHAYQPDGYFSSEYMLDVVGEFHKQALAEGYEGSRGSGEMTWALMGDVDMAEVLTYEAKLTEKLHESPYTAICQYDARKFSGQMIMDVLSVHPVMIVQGQLVKNPHYIPCEKFLADYRRRHASG